MPRSKTSHQHPYAPETRPVQTLAVAVVRYLLCIMSSCIRTLTTHMTHHLGALRTLLCAGMLLVTLSHRVLLPLGSAQDDGPRT